MSSSFSRQLKPLVPGGWWRAIAHGAWAVAAVALIAAPVLGFLVRVLIGFSDAIEAFFATNAGTFTLYALQYITGLAALLVYPVLIRKLSREKIAHLLGVGRRFLITDLGAALLSVVPYFAISIALQALAVAFISGFDASEAQNIGFGATSSLGELVLVFGALVILAPLAEELIFRGYMFGHGRQNLNFWPAAVITSLIFAIAHGQWNVGLDTFVLSMVLCYLREKTGSIWAGVILHALKNALAYSLLFIWKVG